jgi:hypothetical protein
LVGWVGVGGDDADAGLSQRPEAAVAAALLRVAGQLRFTRRFVRPDGADQTDQDVAVGEDSDDVGAAAGLTVE